MQYVCKCQSSSVNKWLITVSGPKSTPGNRMDSSSYPYVQNGRGTVHPYTMETANSYPVARSPRVEAGSHLLPRPVMRAAALPGLVNAFMAWFLGTGTHLYYDSCNILFKGREDVSTSSVLFCSVSYFTERVKVTRAKKIFSWNLTSSCSKFFEALRVR